MKLLGLALALVVMSGCGPMDMTEPALGLLTRHCRYYGEQSEVCKELKLAAKQFLTDSVITDREYSRLYEILSRHQRSETLKQFHKEIQ